MAARDYRRAAEVGLLGCAGLCFVVLTWYHWPHICDDAFIGFRYAENVVAGAGPVWNRGEAVEGYSSPLWLGLLVVGRALGAALPAWAGAWGVGCALVCLLLVHRLALALSESRLTAAAAGAAGALLYPLYYWAPAGLETTMFAALVTAAAWSLVARSAWAWAPVAALLGVARPEGPLLVLALLGLARLAHGRAALRPGQLLVGLGPAAAGLAFRRWYFGEWLPNTYFAKATGELLARLTTGTIYASLGLAALVATVAAVWVGGLATRKHLAGIAFAGVVLAVVMGAGGDWMWHARLLLPVLPACLAFTSAGVAATPAGRRFVVALGCVLAWSGFLPRPGLLVDAFTGGRLPAVAFQEGTLVSANLAAAHFIAEHYPAEALLAVNHAGALPYALPNPVIDMAGLCDRHIAREVAGGLHQKFDPAYVLARKPRLVVLNSRVRPGTAGTWYHPGYWAGETALVAQPEFAARYRALPSFWAWRWQGTGGGGYVLLYERISDGPI